MTLISLLNGVESVLYCVLIVMGESSTECGSTLWLSHSSGWADNHRHCWWFFKVSPNLGFAREFIRETLVGEGREMRSEGGYGWLAQRQDSYSDSRHTSQHASTASAGRLHSIVHTICSCIYPHFDVDDVIVEEDDHQTPPASATAGKPPSYANDCVWVAGRVFYFRFPQFCFHFPKQSSNSGGRGGGIA